SSLILKVYVRPSSEIVQLVRPGTAAPVKLSVLKGAGQSSESAWNDAPSLESSGLKVVMLPNPRITLVSLACANTATGSTAAMSSTSKAKRFIDVTPLKQNKGGGRY